LTGALDVGVLACLQGHDAVIELARLPLKLCLMVLQALAHGAQPCQRVLGFFQIRGGIDDARELAQFTL